MNAVSIQCPRCQSALTGDSFNRDEFLPCPSCATPLNIDVFPALFRRMETGLTGEAVMMEGEASCFYHPAKKAILPCEECGRFLCNLCDCEHQGRHLCPACLETGRTKGKIKSLENKRTRYDNLAMTLALAPMLIFYLTIITAPVAVFIAIRHWRSPLGFTQRNRIKLAVAGLIGLLQIAGWAILLVVMLDR